MQVDNEPFPINLIDFDGTKVLIRSSADDKGKGKEVIIGDTWKAGENNKNSYRKVVAERTTDGGETLMVNITTSNTGGRRRQVTRRGSLFCASRMVRCIEQTVRVTARQSGSLQRTIRQRPGATMTTYIQTTTTRKRYVEN
jgi:hypothetical protein